MRGKVGKLLYTRLTLAWMFVVPIDYESEHPMQNTALGLVEISQHSS